MQAAEQSHDDAPKLMKREALYYTSGLAPTPTVVPRPHSFGGELWSQTPKATLLPAVAAVTRHAAATDQVKSLHAILRKKFKNEKILHVLDVCKPQPQVAVFHFVWEEQCRKITNDDQTAASFGAMVSITVNTIKKPSASPLPYFTCTMMTA